MPRFNPPTAFATNAEALHFIRCRSGNGVPQVSGRVAFLGILVGVPLLNRVER